MDPRVLFLACGLLFAVAQVSGSPCTVCDGDHGEDVCSCAQQVIRPPLVVPPRRRTKKPATEAPKCSCQKEHVEYPPVQPPKSGCSCQNNQQEPSELYEPQNYKYPQQNDKYPHQYYKYPQQYYKNPQSYDTSSQHYKQPQTYGKPTQDYDQTYQSDDGYQVYSQGYETYDQEQQNDEEPSIYTYPDDDEDEDHTIYKRSLGGYRNQGQQRPSEGDDGVTYYPVGIAGRVGVDATSRMLARQLEKKRGKSVKEDGLIFGPRTLPVDGEVKPTESNVNEGGLQQYDKEVLELKSSSTGFSEEEEYAGDAVDSKKLITYSQIGYQRSSARAPDFLRRIPAKPQPPPIKAPILPPLQHLPRVPLRTHESSPPSPQDGYLDEYPQHHEHFQRFIKRLQEAHKTAKKPYFGEKKYY